MKKFMILTALLFSISSFAAETNNNIKKNVETIYSYQGQVIGTISYCDFDKIPKVAISTITRKYTYPEYNLKECIEFTDVYGDKRYIIDMSSTKERLILDTNSDGEVIVASRIRK